MKTPMTEFSPACPNVLCLKLPMRLLSPTALCLSPIVLSFAACGPSSAQESSAQDRASQKWDWSSQDKLAPVSDTAKPLVAAARKRLEAHVIYNGAYVSLSYPGGDVPPSQGVCTDVIIRSLRKAYAFDLQKAVHEDMKANFSAYPTQWGLTRPDKNIDHRRVPNLEVWFTRAGYALPKTKIAADYLPGDIVSWRLSPTGAIPHIGIVSERLSKQGTPLIIHNIGGGPEEDDMLFDFTITGHFRLNNDFKSKL